MRKITYGLEAIDYFHSRLLIDGDTLSTLLLSLDLVNGGDITATLPDEVDTANLYRFRTDIFWGRPEDPSRDVVMHLIALIGELGSLKNGMLISECWTTTGFDPEQREVDYFSYRSTKRKGELRYCHFLKLKDAGELRLRSFLSRCDCDHPIIFSDVSSLDEGDSILEGNEVTEKTLSAIIEGTAHLIFEAYDGGAHLIWTRRSRQ